MSNWHARNGNWHCQLPLDAIRIRDFSDALSQLFTWRKVSEMLRSGLHCDLHTIIFRVHRKDLKVCSLYNKPDIFSTPWAMVVFLVPTRNSKYSELDSTSYMYIAKAMKIRCFDSGWNVKCLLIFIQWEIWVWCWST